MMFFLREGGGRGLSGAFSYNFHNEMQKHLGQMIINDDKTLCTWWNDFINQPEVSDLAPGESFHQVETLHVSHIFP